MDKKEISISQAVLISGVLISASILVGAFYSSASKIQKPESAPTISDDFKIKNGEAVLGNPNAKITFVEYGDYQCPFCGLFFTDIEPKLQKDYINTGKINMVYRNIQFLGQESIDAGNAAECAKDQGKFWEYHDAIYKAEIADGHENNGNLNKTLFTKLANDTGLNISTFAKCYDSGKYKEKVLNETRDANLAGINSTPTSFVNGQMIKGVVSYDKVKEIIDGVLK